MTDKTRSQAQQTFEPFRGFAQDQIDRMGTIFEEWKKLEAQGVERAHAAIDEAAKLVKTSFGYATQLTEEWRKLALAAGRQAMDLTHFKMQ